jgi:NhaP-type Na+/H+ or K+/H+ antiporter
MFDYAELIAFTLVLVSIGAVSMLSGLLRVYRSVTPPMLYIFVGVVAQVILQHTGYSVGDSPGVRNLILLIAELTLSYVLFHDASVVDLHEIEWHIPGRLLTVGMPLTLVLLYFVTAALLPTISFFAKLLIAAALTPTDAGLGAATVTNHHVPSRVRQALNVESGINDGVITPIVLIAIAGMREGEDGGPGLIPKVALIPISISIALTVCLPLMYLSLYDYRTILSLIIFFP